MAVITVSRMFGSGGSEIARRVSDALGWTLLDNAFVERVATALHATPAVVEAIEEKAPSLAERIADAFAYGAQEMLTAPLSSPLPPSEERVLEVTRQVIEEAVARGPVVLVGRGAQMRLASRADALHVMCTVTRDIAIERVAARESIPADEAAMRVEEENKRRAQFVKRYWNRAWLDASNYHLCVNTAWTGIDGAAELVVRLAREYGLATALRS
ncbi:MAG: AAA family ATPase [Gemmatimonadaceae bacterium]